MHSLHADGALFLVTVTYAALLLQSVLSRARGEKVGEG